MATSVLSPKRLQLDIWSDIACPWCYVGKRRLESALASFPQRDQVDVKWHSFELDPSAPKSMPTDVPYAARLARKYGKSTAEAQGMVDRMTDMARADGLDFHFEKAQPSNTFDAHRLLHFADTQGKQNALKERLFAAYLSEGVSMGDTEALVRLAGEVGLDTGAARAVLAGDDFTVDVRRDEADARELGVSGVPFFVFAGRYGVSGAQPAEGLLEVLEKAWEEIKPSAVMAEGAVCGPDGCA